MNLSTSNLTDVYVYKCLHGLASQYFTGCALISADNLRRTFVCLCCCCHLE